MSTWKAPSGGHDADVPSCSETLPAPRLPNRVERGMPPGEAAEMIAWTHAQIDEDERVARRVLQFSRDSYARTVPEAWVAERKVNNASPPFYDYQLVRTERPGTVQREILRLDVDYGGMTADHVARFASPRRVLARVAADRAILEEHAIEDPDDEWRYCRVCHDRLRHDQADAPCRTVRLLVQSYAGQDGWREEWVV